MNAEQDVVSFYLGKFVKRAMELALDAEGRETLTLDPRVRDVFGGARSLGELMGLFRTLNSYLGTSDYPPLPR